MASVHLGRMSGSAGFTRFVAIKRLHPHLASGREFSELFLDEARLAARLRHPNIVETLDVVREGSDVLIVMELVEGASLSVLSRSAAAVGARLSPALVSAVALGILRGLHAAHMAKAPSGAPLNIVHRDVSPQNVLIGVDGVPRVLDFGVARANGQLHATKSGEVRGKLAYMAPEHLRGSATQKSDLYAAGVVLWELLAGERLYRAEDDAALLGAVLYEGPRPLPAAAVSAAPALAAIVSCALSQDPAARSPNAAAMAARSSRRCHLARRSSSVIGWSASHALNSHSSVSRSRRSMRSQGSVPFASPRKSQRRRLRFQYQRRSKRQLRQRSKR
jgi:serine/threonine-protein kinase